ncbi:MAG: hypothetical protein OK422_01495 [Thaumarchaeota archaeon]|nr:hypothetical protein [Nitrososphaerota archaeon]
MKEIIELKMVISKVESVILKEEHLGLTFEMIKSTISHQFVVTDRLLVSDEAVRV